MWIPDTVGEYEVLAEAVNAQGDVIASLARHITIGANLPPSITITGVTGTSPIQLATQVSDPDGDEIRRVEYYDNGVWIGTDYDENDNGVFGEEIDIESFDLYMYDPAYDLLRGTHSFTAKAFDSRGAIGETALPFDAETTQGNARPMVTIDSPLNGTYVTAGDSFDLECSVDDPDGLSDLTEVWVYDITSSAWGLKVAFSDSPPFTPIAVDTTGWTAGMHVLGVIAWDESGYYSWSYAQYLHVYVEDPAEPSFAETLVANIVDEATATPVGATFTGIQLSSAEYEDGISSGLQIDAGILLTSGLASLWNGGDRFDGADENLDLSFVNRIEPGDPDLADRVVGVRTTDAASLEFDVFCLNGQLELDYQFGSEEYDEFVGSFNDGFMIIINRPGEVGGTVVSLLPDCPRYCRRQHRQPDVWV